MITSFAWTLGLLACTAPEPADSQTTDSLTDSGAVDSGLDTGPLDTSGLNGTEVDPRREPPTFSQVVNSDGSARSQADLLGHPTVIWFYPDAGTYG